MRIESSHQDFSPAEARVIDLLRGGERPSPDVVNDVALGRNRELTDLRGRSGPAQAEALAEQLRSLEALIARLEEGDAGHPRGSPAILALEGVLLGLSTRRVLALADALSPTLSGDPLDLVEGELRTAERSVENLERLEPSLSEAAGRLRHRLAQARDSVTRARLERLQGRKTVTSHPAKETGLEGARGCWNRLDEVLLLGRRLRCPGDPSAFGASELEGLEAAGRARESELKAAFQALPADRAVDLLAEKAALLLDEAGAVLSEGALAEPLRRVAELQVYRARAETLLKLSADLEARDAGGQVLPEKLRKDLRLVHRAARRARWLEEEAQARRRLESRLGARVLKHWETLLLFLLLGFVGVITLEWRLGPGSRWAPWIFAADVVLCLLFQVDFLLRWESTGWSPRHFLSRFFFESLPAFPYSLLLHHAENLSAWLGLEELRAVILVRLLGLRSVLLVVMRLFRVLVFFIQGSDRLVEKLRPALDRDVLVFDDPAPAEVEDFPPERHALALEGKRRSIARRLLEELPWATRLQVLEDCVPLLETEAKLHARTEIPHATGASVDLPDLRIERLIHELLDLDGARVLSSLGVDGTARVARWLRFFDVPVIRSGPLVRRLIPAARLQNPAEAVASAGHEIGRILQQLVGAVRFWGDLSGITTGPQIVDRIGTGLVAASSRPAVRLLLISSLFMAFKGFAVVVPPLETAATGLWRGLGTPFLVLGLVCLVLLFLGRWLKRVAGEALDSYLRTADAHFYPLLKTWKIARRRSDLGLLVPSVFAQEVVLTRGKKPDLEHWARLVEEEVERGLRAGAAACPALEGEDVSAREKASLVALSYLDFLDGPILHRSDDKTSLQLLGNLSVQDVRFQVLGLTRRQFRALERLDLEKQRTLGLGPYFWFRFITESLAIETAKLIIEYNTTCVPLSEIPLATEERRLAADRLLAPRSSSERWSGRRVAGRPSAGSRPALSTNDFTALHFLSADPERDEAVRRRYGTPVLDALIRDRRAMVRDIFGTRPYHQLPREHRAFNLYRLYGKYLRGVLFLLLPLILCWGLVRLLLLALRDVVRLVLDTLGISTGRVEAPDRTADFAAAARKIHRMRKPFFLEALLLRASVDVDYLGLKLPGIPRDPSVPTYEHDLALVGALESDRRPLEALRDSTARDLRLFRQELDSRGWLAEGLEDLLTCLDPSRELLQRRGEVVRALVTAFVTNHNDLRTIITAESRAREHVERCVTSRPGLWLRVWLEAAGAASWVVPGLARRRRLFERYVEVARYPRDLKPIDRRRARLELLLAPRTLERVFRQAVRCLSADGGARAVVDAELRAAIAAHADWTRRILALRAIQAVTVLDVRSYLALVREVGGWD